MKSPEALHINSYFLTNEIHYNFYLTLKKYRNDKFLIPVYNHFKRDYIQNVEIDYIYNSLDKLIFFSKVVKVLFLLFKKKMLRGYDYIHAHTLMSDGIPAFFLSYIIKKPYVVTVRNADVNFYIKRSIFFKLIAEKILSNARIVFFVSPSYKKLVEDLFPNLNKSKHILLPNGIDNYWLNNLKKTEDKNSNFNKVNILFVGKIIKLKNLSLLLDFVKCYDDRCYNLNIVGENVLGYDFKKLNESLNNGNSINFIGKVTNKAELLNIYRQNDIFVLLSSPETFGVVYIEALSQGLPIIYTKGQGVDGYFEDGMVGVSCGLSVVELKSKLEYIISNYSIISANTTLSVNDFTWESLAKEYINNINNNLNINCKIGETSRTLKGNHFKVMES